MKKGNRAGSYHHIQEDAAGLQEVAGMEKEEDAQEIALAVGGLWPEFKVWQEHPRPPEF